MLAVALGLSSSLCWGLADFLGGLQTRRLNALFVVAASQAAGLVAVALAVALLAGSPPPLGQLWPAAAAGVAGAAALGAFYRGLAIGTMSIVAPIAASGVVLPVLVGVASGERPSALQLGGIALAVGGVVLASRESHEDAERQAAARRSLVLALWAAVGFGLFFVGLGASADDDPLWASLFARLGSLALLGPVCLALRKRLHPVPGALPALALVGVLDVGANVLFAFASTLGLLSVVAVLGALYPIVTVVLARTLLRERVRRLQQVGVACALGGVVLLAGG